MVGGVADASAPQGYEYVARRATAVVGLAEARGLDPRIARAAVDRLADALDACAAGERRKGEPGQGAARVVAQIEPGGAVGGTTLRAEPGEGVAREAALCLVAPVRLLTFPPADSGSRGLALEALWGQPR